MEKIHEILFKQAAQNPSSVALYWHDSAISFSALSTSVHDLAASLSAIGQKGDRVAVLAWNSLQFIELIYAVAASGRILVPLNARLAPAELSYQLDLTGTSLLFGDEVLLAPLRKTMVTRQNIKLIGFQSDYESWQRNSNVAVLPKTNEDDIAWILFTSGSTGRPKGAELTHRSFMAGLRSGATGRPVKKDDRYLFPFPLFHVAAHNVLLQHQFGAAVVLMKSFDAGDTLHAIREFNVSTMSLAPTMISMLLDHPSFHFNDLQGIRNIGYGASAMPKALLLKLLKETNIGLCQGYGMTELSGNAMFLTEHDHILAASTKPHLLASIGKPAAAVQVTISNEAKQPCGVGEIGEITVKSPQCMQAYWDQVDASKATIVNGYLHTGDLGYFDDEGYFYLVDRKKDMIISGGENVASREVEDVIRRHSAVKECAVIGLVDAKWGEVVCAVLNLNIDVPDSELIEHCKKHIASYKTPKRWARIKTLPINAAGKIDKQRLRAEFSSFEK